MYQFVFHLSLTLGIWFPSQPESLDNDDENDSKNKMERTSKGSMITLSSIYCVERYSGGQLENERDPGTWKKKGRVYPCAWGHREVESEIFVNQEDDVEGKENCWYKSIVEWKRTRKRLLQVCSSGRNEGIQNQHCESWKLESTETKRGWMLSQPGYTVYLRVVFARRCTNEIGDERSRDRNCTKNEFH